MDSFINYPLSYSELCDLEEETLRCLHQFAVAYDQLSMVASEAKVLLYRDKSRGFSFFTYWESDCLYGRYGRCRIFLGEAIRPTPNGDIQEATGFFCVTDNAGNDSQIVFRKFHFDYTPGGDSDRQPVPHFHLQYAGKLCPRLKMHVTEKQLEPLWPGLSEPRIVFTPMSLALLFSIAFTEFPSEQVGKFVESNEWQKIVRENEYQLFLPYHNLCAEKIRRNHSAKKDTIFDHLYVGSQHV